MTEYTMTSQLLGSKRREFTVAGKPHIICETFQISEPYAEFYFEGDKWVFVRTLTSLPSMSSIKTKIRQVSDETCKGCTQLWEGECRAFSFAHSAQELAHRTANGSKMNCGA